MNWYTTSKENDLQGLVCDEDTGKNIAVSYDAKDAQLIAAAPELLKALQDTNSQIEAVVSKLDTIAIMDKGDERLFGGCLGVLIKIHNDNREYIAKAKGE